MYLVIDLSTAQSIGTVASYDEAERLQDEAIVRLHEPPGNEAEDEALYDQMRLLFPIREI